jgi:YfiH family protein
VERYLVLAREAKEQLLKYGSQSKGINKDIILPNIFKSIPKISAGMSTRIGSDVKTHYGMNLSFMVGDDPLNVKKNRNKFFSQLGISEQQLAVPLQCHSYTVQKVDKPGEYGNCDALVTNIKNVALIVTIADCVPILLFDPINVAIAVVHAGWRGTAGKISKHTVKKMKEEFLTDPSVLLAFIGPSAGSCCYEVGDEVAVMFDNKIVPYHRDKKFIDLKNENKLQLQSEGLLSDHIEVSGYCTICEKRLFHSFRRDGPKAGRMMAVICIVP